MAEKGTERFARVLADSTNKQVRDRAVKALTRFLAKKKDMDKTELLKLWKALHFCYWLSDKTPVQIELAERLASLIHSLGKETKLLWIEAFYDTMRREWETIDYWRVDKYYSLIRRVQREIFKAMDTEGFDQALVQKYTSSMVESLFIPAKVDAATGVRYHVIDLYVKELHNAAGSQMSMATIMGALEPFFVVLCRATDKHMNTRIIDDVLGKLLECAVCGENESDDEDEDEEELLKFDNIDMSLISGRVFQCASAPDTREGNRGKLYSLRKALEKEGFKGMDLFVHPDGSKPKRPRSETPAKGKKKAAKKDEEKTEEPETPVITPKKAKAATPKSAKGKVAKEQVVEDEDEDVEVEMTPKRKKAKANLETPKSSAKKSRVNVPSTPIDLDYEIDGDDELRAATATPNKKRKADSPQTKASSPKMTPAKAKSPSPKLKASSPMQTPSKPKGVLSPKTPAATPSAKTPKTPTSTRKVNFNMKKNTVQEFNKKSVISPGNTPPAGRTRSKTGMTPAKTPSKEASPKPKAATPRSTPQRKLKTVTPTKQHAKSAADFF